jgi:hypothetical protein
MHPNFCMHENFDVITNPFKYKCDTSQVLYIHFKKLWWVKNATHE